MLIDLKMHFNFHIQHYLIMLILTATNQNKTTIYFIISNQKHFPLGQIKQI